ncbi:MAG: hypothetical protein IT573_05005 [Deltaproteobacteria bacterium]|nr:hypothetical protein [Deltaproteobacteria bacterium]
MKSFCKVLTFLAAFSLALPGARAVDINLVNIDLGSPEARRAEQLYGNAYGFAPQQVTPALLAPAEEVPAIMQIAQAAGTLPLSVWMMRKMGMSYSNILQSFSVAPLVAMGSPVTDPYYIQTTRTHFLQNILQVNPILFPKIPLVGPDFTRFLIYPVHKEHGYWMPPGIAKKYGLWIPPGQAKKMGLWGGPGKGKGGYWVVDDDGAKGKKGKWDNDDDGGWKKSGKGKEHGHGKGGGGWKAAKGNGKGGRK